MSTICIALSHEHYRRTFHWDAGDAKRMIPKKSSTPEHHSHKRKRPQYTRVRKSSLRHADSERIINPVNDTVIANRVAVTRLNAPCFSVSNDDAGFDSLSHGTQRLQQEVRLQALKLLPAETSFIEPSSCPFRMASTHGESRLSKRRNCTSFCSPQRISRGTYVRLQGDCSTVLPPSTAEGDWQMVTSYDYTGIGEVCNTNAQEVDAAKARPAVSHAPKASPYFVSRRTSDSCSRNHQTSDDPVAQVAKVLDPNVSTTLHSPPSTVKHLATHMTEFALSSEFLGRSPTRRNSTEFQAERLLALFKLVEAADNPSSLPAFEDGIDSEEGSRPIADSSLGTLSFGNNGRNALATSLVYAFSEAEKQSPIFLSTVFRPGYFDEDVEAMEGEVTVKAEEALMALDSEENDWLMV